MNNDLISREALKEVFNGYHSGIGSQPKFTLGACLQLIDNAPTVAEDYDTGYQDGLEDGLNDIIPQGEWLHPYKTNIACECSNCHMQMPITDYFNFCPKCGAYMRKGGAE